MSFDVQFLRKLQSSQAPYTVAPPSISAVGSGLVRSEPATPAKRAAEIVTARDHEAPPLVDRNAPSLPFRLSNGTTTVPFGCTSGWPPRPLSLPSVWTGVRHVLPPSVEGANPMSVAPPSKKRPTWNAERTVEPFANVSGSTSVACWLVVFANGSWLIAVSGTFAPALAGSTSSSSAAASAPINL